MSDRKTLQMIRVVKALRESQLALAQQSLARHMAEVEKHAARQQGVERQLGDLDAAHYKGLSGQHAFSTEKFVRAATYRRDLVRRLDSMKEEGAQLEAQRSEHVYAVGAADRQHSVIHRMESNVKKDMESGALVGQARLADEAWMLLRYGKATDGK